MSARRSPYCMVPFVLALCALPGIPRPTEAAAPELIPREYLFENPERSEPALSPDGRSLAYLAPSPDGVSNIWVRPVERDRPKMVTEDRHRGIYTFHWAEDGTYLLYIQDQAGDENWHLYASDVASGEVRDLTPYPGVSVPNLITDRNHPGEVLVSMNRRDPSAFDLVRIRLADGATEMAAENPGDVTEWAVDRDFRVRAAVALDAGTSDTIIRVRTAPGEPWRDVARWPFVESGSVLYRKILGFTADGTGLYMQTYMGGDMSRIVVLDAATGREVREVASDPRSDVWNIEWQPEVVLDPATGAPQAVGFDYLVPEWRVLDPAVEPDFEALRKLSPGAFLIGSRDRDDRRWVVKTWSDTVPPAWYLYDRTTRKASLLFGSMPELAGYVTAPMKPVTFTSRDGLVIPAYLTLPPGVKPEKLPMVLYVHGGPWYRDDWDFRPDVQHLANRGYAVLQVNFRGSTGYGKAYLNASTRQWGVGGMQNDLTDAVRWAVDRGIADPARVAIMGGSYGGYATLAGITFTPDLYVCAVDIVGPSNVATLFDSMPPYWKVRRTRWKLRVGDAENDKEFNRRISPFYHVDAIRAPLLIGHGANDPRVTLPESETIVAAMRKHKLPVTFVVYPDEGHGFARPENNLDFGGRVEEFLGRYLGGRVEPWKAIPGSSAEVR
jgi:dipeptidyl aminopeptidase/acylaminoacyl peptidase